MSRRSTIAAAVALAAALGPQAEADLTIPAPDDGHRPEPPGEEPPAEELVEVLDHDQYRDLHAVQRATLEYLSRRKRSAESVRADSVRVQFESVAITIGLLELLGSLLPLVAPDAAVYRLVPPAVVGDRDLKAEADVARDLHDALRVEWGMDPYARIRALYDAIEQAAQILMSRPPVEDARWNDAASQWVGQQFLPLAEGRTPIPITQGVADAG